MDIYLKKANILTKFFGLYGYGHFDISNQELAQIIKLLCEAKDNDLQKNIQEIYENLERKYL